MRRVGTLKTKSVTGRSATVNGADGPQPAAQKGDSAKVQDALYRIADMASAASDMSEFYAEMHSVVGELMYGDNFYIALYDEDENTLNYPYYRDEVDLEFPEPDAWEPMGTGQARGLTAYVLRTGEPQLVPNQRYRALVDSGEVDQIGVYGEDWLGVPLRAEGKTIGVLVVQTYEKGQHYSQQDVELLTFVGQHVASALSRARAIAETRRLLDETNQRAAELEIVNSVQAGLAQRLDPQQMYDLVGDKIRQIFDAQVVDIGVVDEDAGLIRFPYTIERGVRFPDEPIEIIGFRRHVLETRGALVISARADERAAEFGQPVAIQGEAARSLIFAPLVVGGQASGVISVQNLDREHAFSDADVRLLATLAGNLSVALENVRLVDGMRQREADARRRASEMAALAEVGREISSTLDQNKVLGRIAEQARQLLEGKSSAVYLASDDGAGTTLEATVVVGENADEIAADPIALGKGIIGDLAARAAAEMVNDVDADARAVHIAGTDEEPNERLIIAPLLAGARMIGMMAVWRSGESAPFVQENLDFLVGLSQQAAVAIGNARLYAEAEVARAEADRHRHELSRFLPSTVAELMATPGGSPLLGAHRREITAFFCDLRGFTDFTQTAEPEEVFDLLADYQRSIGQLVLENGGTLEHYAGDGIFGFFNDPQEVADHPLVGVTMALEMQRRFGEIARSWERRGFELGIGIGLSTGYATVGRVGFEGYYLYAAIGNVANLAARLCAMAQPGQVVISGRTYAQIEESVEVEPLGTVELKGFRRPVEAFAVVGLSRGPAKGAADVDKRVRRPD